MSDAGRLSSIRASLAAISPGEWTRVHDAAGCFVEVRGAFGELCELARFHPGATDDEIAFAVGAPGNVRFLLGLVDRAISKLKPADRKVDAAVKNYAAEAAIKCSEPAFKKFLEEEHGLERPLTDSRAAQKLRGILGVTSRRELNSDAAAAVRWKKLRRQFEAWRRAGR